MKKIVAVAGLFIFFGAAIACAENNFSAKKKMPIVIEKPLDRPALGESLVYDVLWMGIPIGVGTLDVKEMATVGGRSAFHIVAVARTNEFLSKLYPVEDEVHTYIDAEHGFSLQFSKTLKEGRYRADEKILYDYAAMKGTYESKKNGSVKTFDLPSKVQDMLSAFYWFRYQTARAGDRLHTVINGEEKNWDLEIVVLKEEEKEIRGLVVPALLVEPKTRLKGILYDRGRAWVHFSADKRRLPLLITLKTPFGPVVGVLRGDAI